ncbi:hypothetical protein MAR_037635 [Mya arenaria]|uniref:Uncharacterized protein n=1 Tax=Mya arenaria TaxID=6604 RepID=A0ABY7FXU4_MYAAR|nr:hypothetical protein MAR_037635 [Mya arenaria]
MMNDSANLPNQLERWRHYSPLGKETYIGIFLVIVQTFADDPKYSAVEFDGCESPNCAMAMHSPELLLVLAEFFH